MYCYTICDWIWDKPASTHTTARWTFHHQTIAVHDNKCNQQFRQRMVLKVAQVAFAEACQMSTVLEWSFNGSISPSKQIYPAVIHYMTGWWVWPWTCLLCVTQSMWMCKWHQWIPFCWFQWGCSLFPPLCDSLPPSTPMEVFMALARPMKKLAI